LNDIDYINFLSNQAIQDNIQRQNSGSDDLDLIDRSPQIKIASKFFRNDGDLRFSDQGARIANAKRAYSNGAVYADLDNDGDLDIAVNNIDEPALLYRNNCNDRQKKAFAEIKLKGPEKNINALGAKLILFTGNGVRTYEKYPVHGFLSSTETPIHVGLDKTTVDSAFLVWPDNTFEPIRLPGATPFLTVTWKPGLPKFDYSMLTGRWKPQAAPMKDITDATGLLHKHQENNFNEFDREPLIPHMLSTEGPALAIGDIDHDGLEDVFIGAARRGKCAVYRQDGSGRFIKTVQPDLESDSSYEDVDACITDLDNDGHPDLVIASGGNEFYGPDAHLTPRVFLNDGHGHLKKKDNAFDTLFVNASCVAPCDFDGDGFTDLFIGGRSVPNNYGATPRSYLLRNDGTGHFTDVTNILCKDLAHVGFVTSACWVPLSGNGRKDLVLSLEWGGILAFVNDNGSFRKTVLSDKKGWWNFVLPVDLDNDGRMDFVAGNLGLNSRLKASGQEPVRMYYYDFDGNGKKDQVLTYYLSGREIPFATMGELEKQIPEIKKKYLYATDFAKATLDDLFSTSRLSKADTLTANYFSNAVLLNQGNGKFTTIALPWEAQLSSYRDAIAVQANDDSLPDILLVGNYYENNIQMGRYDADFGTILVNHGSGSFTAETLNGIQLKGQARHIRRITIGKTEAFVVARNNDSTRIIQFARPPKQKPKK
jgi:hypothetical protein